MAMDLITSPATGAAIGAQPTTLNRTPDSDTETPPLPPQQTAKRVLQTHHHAPPPAAVVSYKECLKNHAASIGGHALDGCCEFMPGPRASPSDPTSLKCAACGCHRNFHRRDPDDPAPLHHHPPATARPPHSPPSASQLLLSLSGQSPSRPSDDINPTAVIFGYHHHPHNNNNTNNNNNNNNNNGAQNGNSRKRFRTKFSQEQKEKMYEFSEKIGWKLRKGEEKLVEEFCKEAGVVRGVFKVWMHNNKHSSASSSSMRREKEQPGLLHLHHPHQQHNNTSNNNNNNNSNSNNNGSCGSVVDHHQFYASNGAQQEAQ